MACIYHIYSSPVNSNNESKEIYIGQTSGDVNPNSFSKRPMAHFSGVYSKAASSRENAMFFEFLEKYPLNSMTIEIYNENNLFGLSQDIYTAFFDEWSVDGMKPNWTIQELNNGELKITENQRKLAMSFYLDAAEIIHNYIYYHKGRILLTHQIGGQKTTFRSKNGLVMNSTMDVETACKMIDAEQTGVVQLQKEFDKILNKYLYTYTINGETLPEALARSAIEHSTANTDYVYDWTKIIVSFFKGILPIIRDDLDKILAGNCTINISNKIKNLYSYSESKFMWNFNSSNKGSFNIINALVQKLTTSKRKKKYKDLQDIIQELANEIEQELHGSFDGNISFANFFTIEVDNKYLKPRDWKITGSCEIHHALDTDAYGESFRKRAYWFFSNEVEKVWKSMPKITIPRYIDSFGTRYYIVSTYRLSSLLYKQFKKDVKNQYIINHWEDYMHPMLTLYTQRHQTTIGGTWRDYAFLGQNLCLAIPDVGVVSVLTDSLSIGGTMENNGGYENQKIADGFLSYQFSSDTLEDIIEWANKQIIDLTVF